MAGPPSPIPYLLHANERFVTPTPRRGSLSCRPIGKFLRQIVLYVGEAFLRMAPRLDGPDVSFRYEIIDIRDLDGERLLASEQVSDNVIALLTRLRDRESAIREVVRKISGLEGSQRELALRQLIILAGLRRLEGFIEQEVRKVPLLDDIMDNKVCRTASNVCSRRCSKVCSKAN